MLQEVAYNPFHEWLNWLRDLGGSYEPMRDLSESKPRTGRRDPDKQPRTYAVDKDKYFYDRRGTLRRREIVLKEAA